MQMESKEVLEVMEIKTLEMPISDYSKCNNISYSKSKLFTIEMLKQV